MRGHVSRYFAGTRSTHRCGGSMMWSSADISRTSEGSMMALPRRSVGHLTKPYHRRVAKARPRGREEVMNALLESARKLIVERGPSVALRDIADDAGVNFGLLYHYLGT